MAKVDATEQEKLAQKFGVEGYPTIFEFRNGVKAEYDGPREKDGILQWIEEQVRVTVPAVVRGLTYNPNLFDLYYTPRRRRS